MATYGYARVSTTDQDLTIQVTKLKEAGCEVIRQEKFTGTTRDGRTELRTLLDFIRPGDILMVTRIDRLARSIGDLQDIVRELRTRGASLKATEQPIDTAAWLSVAGSAESANELNGTVRGSPFLVSAKWTVLASKFMSLQRIDRISPRRIPVWIANMDDVGEETIAALGESGSKPLQLFDGDPAFPRLARSGLLDLRHGVLFERHAPFVPRDLQTMLQYGEFAPNRRRRDGS